MNEHTKKVMAYAADERQKLLSKCGDMRAQQANVISRLVEENRDTAFGKEHGFSAIKNLDDYRRSVPIRDYDAIEPWVERQAKGEAGVLTKAAPVLYRRTSGTTGPSKKIPCTQQFLDEDNSYLAMVFCRMGVLFPETLRADGSATLAWNKRHAPPERLPGDVPWIPYSHQCTPKVSSDALYGAPGSFAPWYEVPEGLSDLAEVNYFRLRLMLESDVRGMMNVNPSSFVALAHQMRAQTDQLIGDVRAGTLRGKPLKAANPQRADELHQLCGTDGLLPRAAWPKLQAIQCWKSASASFYLPQVKELYGEQIEIIDFCYLGSEGMYTLPIDVHESAGIAMFDRNFFEFVPASEPLEPDSKTLLLHEIEEGREYHIVHTASTGLYRHTVGDFVTVRGFHDGVPLFEFSGRKGLVSSFTGEKLTESHVITALRQVESALGLRIQNFTCCPRWGDPPGYVFVIELVAGSKGADAADVARRIDDALGDANEEYPSKRKTNRIAPVEAHIVAPGTFTRFRDASIAKSTGSAAQYKEKFLQKDAAPLDDLLATSRQRV